MRKIEFRLHALKDTGDRQNLLSPDGLRQAKRVGAEQLRGKGYTHVLISGSFYAAQTACAMAEGAGDFAASNLIVPSALCTVRTMEFEIYENECGQTVRPEHPLIKEESFRMATEFADFVLSLPNDSHVLAIGESPFLEILIYGLIGKVVEPLEECDKFELDDSQFQRSALYDGIPPL
ncbi:MAG: hypothetical protein PHW33_03695 [Candidatus Portnoybacteria bacterium]|nr:hypothetical protein [Candidatus Portnoybacteria bacterium]MDD5437609.1 hypothetical protein [Patescibacteria group bacterium]